MPATNLLKEQPTEVKNFFKKREKGDVNAPTTGDELTSHPVADLALEQELLHPTAGEVLPEPGGEALEEHSVAGFKLKRLLASLPAGDVCISRLTILMDHTDPHVA
ncbi:MAG: hypothetical protein H7338_25060 [Candidatus Sericytochromatia bacterium]|nr:hypothetical protein [Candidatus Sericytochromatia bacterium]